MTNTDLIIRPREDRDLNACADVLIDVHRTDGYPVEGVADPIAWLQPPGLMRAWVAEISGAIVGHAAVTEPQDSDGAPFVWRKLSNFPIESLAVLGRLFVHSRARGKHAGWRLIVAATKYATKRDRRLVLDVIRKDQAAIALYERMGWFNLGSTEHKFGSGESIESVCYLSPE